MGLVQRPDETDPDSEAPLQTLRKDASQCLSLQMGGHATTAIINPVPINRTQLASLVTLVYKYYSIQSLSPTYQSFQNGQLFYEMEQIFQQQQQKKFVLWSGQDSTLQSVLAGIGAYPTTQRPPYVAHLRFEVWEEPIPNGLSYVRAIYNNEVLTLTSSFCSGGDTVSFGRAS